MNRRSHRYLLLASSSYPHELQGLGPSSQCISKQVRFHPEEKVFLSGSEDGLISVFDASSSSSLDEDDGFQVLHSLCATFDR